MVLVFQFCSSCLRRVGFPPARNIDAADRVIGDVFEALRTIASSPQIEHSRSDLTSQPLRFFRVRDYLIVYAPEERPVWIVAVVHGRRNPRVMPAILRIRDK